jgi:carbohydrate-selective porin OprB
MRAPTGRPVILVWATLSVFAAHTYPQTFQGETLSGPDSHETGQGPHGHLLGDWGGVRPYLFERGVRFDLQYISDSLSNIESDRNERL